jgi:hypothetical protein
VDFFRTSSTFGFPANVQLKVSGLRGCKKPLMRMAGVKMNYLTFVLGSLISWARLLI